MANATPQVITSAQATTYMEGPEECKEYYRASGFWFGVSRLGAGETGATDTGHANETEVFLCVEGTVDIYDGETRHRLEKDDALVIPAGVPHTISNVGPVPAFLVWSGSGA